MSDIIFKKFELKIKLLSENIDPEKKLSIFQGFLIGKIKDHAGNLHEPKGYLCYFKTFLF